MSKGEFFCAVFFVLPILSLGEESWFQFPVESVEGDASDQ